MTTARRPARPLLMLAAFAVIAAVGGVVFLHHQRARLRRDTLDYLGAVANLKVHEYQVLLDERLGDAEVAGHSDVFKRAIATGHSDAAALSAAWTQANTLRTSYEYRDVLVLNAAGAVVVGAGPDAAVPVGAETVDAVRHAIETRRTQMVNWWRTDGSTSLVVDLVAPVSGGDDGSPTGAVVLRTTPERRLLPLLAEWPLARPGAVSLARVHGDRVFFFELDLPTPGRPGRERPLATPRLAEAMAARDVLYADVAEDAGGVPVLAAARRASGWIIVAKTRIDQVDAAGAGSTTLTVGWIVTLVLGAFLLMRDRARRAERALAEREATFQTLFENMQDAFLRVEYGGQRRVLRANPAAVRMLGYRRVEDLLGRTITTDQAAAGAGELRRMLAETGVAHNQRSELKHADGTLLPIEANLRLVYDEKHVPVALEGVVRDMTAHDRRQAALVAAREAALEAAEIKTRFLANMSHEIRTPLNAIVGLSHLLLRHPLPQDQRDHVKKIQSSARTLLDIVNSVLDHSKIEAGRLVLDATPFYLDEMLDSTANLVALDAQTKGLELVFTLAEDVPAVVVGDGVRLSQVLINLVNNAVKFTETGEIVVSVEVADGETPPDRVRLRFSVRDTGVGIAAEQVGRLFAPFTQADDSTTRRFGGTGLGLAICRQLVELMSGHIEVASRPGEGSTFTFTVTLGVAPVAGATRARAAGETTRALVVDDNSVSRTVLERYLREMRFDVDTAAGGDEALARLWSADAAGKPFQLVLLDWRMPAPDGVETARLIKTLRLQLAPPTIVMVTAYGREEVAQQLAEVGVAGVLVKPITRSVLFDAIAGVAGARPPIRPEPLASAPHGLAGARVLLVEDNEINQQVARELLLAAGVEVLVAANGRAAVEAVARANATAVRLDAVLMDLQMPELDGYGATAAIRVDPRNAALPIIAMTAHTLELERKRCEIAGMNDYVAKPVDPNVLYAVLDRWIAASAGRAVSPAPSPPPPAPALQIEGVDTAAALRRLRGNRALLLRLLGELSGEWRGGGPRIRDHLARGGVADARLAAHTLAGAAGNLGAGALASAAIALERAVLAGAPAATAEALSDLEAKLAATCAAIDGALAISFVPAPT